MNHWLYSVRSDSLLKDIYKDVNIRRQGSLGGYLETELPQCLLSKENMWPEAKQTTEIKRAFLLAFKIRLESMDPYLLPLLYHFHILSFRLHHTNIHSIEICVKP